MAARVLALLAAVAMVVGAVVLRDRMDEDAERSSTTLRLVCSTELAPVCDALVADDGTDVDATVEAAADTAERLSALGPGETAPLDGWLVAGPWPTIVADARERDGRERQVTSGPVLARSPVVLAVWPDREGVLKRHCPDAAVGWRCLGDNAGMPWASLPDGRAEWGPVKPGHRPTSDALGLAVLGAATAGYFRSAELSAAELATDEYRSWLTRLERAIPGRTPPTIDTMLVRGPSAFDAVGTIEAEAGPLLFRSARDPKPSLLYPDPVATADVVLGTTGGRAAELLGELVSGAVGRRALAGAGWRVRGEKLAPGIPAGLQLPDTSGLPSPGVLDALRKLAGDIR